MNLRIRLNLIVTAVLLVVLLVGSVSAMHLARRNVQAEVASTAVLALKMLDAKNMQFGMDYTWPAHPMETYRTIFELGKLRDIRHIQIDFHDAEGVLRDSNHDENDPDRERVPDWFMQVMDNVSEQMPPTRRPVYFRGQLLGELVVTPDPAHEIAEIWDEARTMLWVLGLFFLIVNLMIYFAVGRALRPIDSIIAGLDQIEAGNLSTRLPEFSLPELGSIGNKFNVMAAALQSSIDRNHHLTQQIIRLQEDERRHLARELHDEIGQQLTAIHVDAGAIMKARRLAAVRESATAISDISKQMMDMVHSMLQRLRPGNLHELGLEIALGELVDAWCQRNRGTSCQLNVDGDFVGVAEPVLVTVYRIVQECLTNISRHARASQVRIDCVREAGRIRLDIEDDGRGFDDRVTSGGFGLAGMAERVQGLGGEFSLQTGIGAGVRIHVRLPLEREVRDEQENQSAVDR